MNGREQQWKSAWLSAIGVILIIVGVIGFGPAGPLPIGNVVVGTIIWLSLAIAPTALGVWLVKRHS